MTDLAIRIKHNRGTIKDIEMETRGFQGDTCLSATRAVLQKNESAVVEMTGEFYVEETEVGLDE